MTDSDIIAQRLSREDCWNALVAERRVPAAPATEARSARLLLVPFWRSASGDFCSAADLRAIGLPPVARGGRTARGLQAAAVGQRHQTDAGSRAGEVTQDAVTVDVMMSPDGGTPGGAAPAGWALQYYPVWAFHYVVFNKEKFHTVDALAGTPIGPARRFRPIPVAMAAASAMLLVFVAAAPFIGPFAALPAWLASVIAARAMMLSHRS